MKCNVLVIDDDPLMGLVSKKIIENAMQAYVTVAPNCSQAIRYLTERILFDSTKKPLYIFLDVFLPDMDAIEFLKEYEKNFLPFYSGTKIIILSSTHDTKLIEELLTYPAVENFILKPLSILAIKQAISSTSFCSLDSKG